MLSNSEKYFFGDFTHRHYDELLKIAKDRFCFSNYSNFDKESNFVLWRHDVDFSMHEAGNLAKIERENGVSSTYFLLLHSEFYNLLDKEIINIVKEIIGLGHEIALHFDPTVYSSKMNKELLVEQLDLEKNILEKVFEKTINVFSFHNPTTEILAFDDYEYAGMINTYAQYFKEKVTYCSDSNGYWRFKRLQDVLQDKSVKQLQVLTHPEWWTENIMSPKEKVWRCVDGRGKSVKEFYVNLLKSYERQIIDWE